MSGASRSMHKSQGFGAARRRGPIIERFQLLADAPGVAPLEATDPLDGLDWSWRRVPGGEHIEKLAAEAARTFRFDNPAASIPALVALDAALEKLAGPEPTPTTGGRASGPRWPSWWRPAPGLHLEGVATGPSVVPGQVVNVAITALNRSAAPVKLVEVAFGGPALLGKRDSVARRQDAGRATIRLRIERAGHSRRRMRFPALPTGCASRRCPGASSWPTPP